jgi:hypothetical protein
MWRPLSREATPQKSPAVCQAIHSHATANLAAINRATINWAAINRATNIWAAINRATINWAAINRATINGALVNRVICVIATLTPRAPKPWQSPSPPTTLKSPTN